MRTFLISCLLPCLGWSQATLSGKAALAGKAVLGGTAAAGGNFGVTFDGSGTMHLDIAQSFLSASNGPFVISFWFKAASLTQTNVYLFVSSTTTGQTAIIYEFVDNQIEVYSPGFTGTDPRTNSIVAVSDTNWHHIAYRKAASGASTWDKFLDGTKTSINASINFTLGTSAAAAFRIGDASGGGAPVAGSLAQLILIDGASLSDGQIAALASACTDPTTLSLGANLKAWWKLNTSAYTDSSGNGFTLSATGSPTFVAGPSACP